MKKNVASQSIGAELIDATTGAAFASTVTVFITGDNGVQAIGSVGAGVCTSEGNGYFSYAPAQAETNFDHIAFTFIGTNAIPATIQLYTDFPQTGDVFTRLGAPVGLSISADIAAIKTVVDAISAFVDTEVAAIKAKTDQLIFTTANKVDAAFNAAADFPQACADKVWSTAARTLTAFGFNVTVATNNDKTGYTLSAPGIQAVWDALTANLTTAGSIGKFIVDMGATVVIINADTDNIQTRLPAALVGGRIDSSVGAMANSVITTAAYAPAAIDNTVISSNANTAIANALFDQANGVETGLTLRQWLRLGGAVLLGKASGLATATAVFRAAVSDSKDRVTATDDVDGNRTAVITDAT